MPWNGLKICVNGTFSSVFSYKIAYFGLNYTLNFNFTSNKNILTSFLQSIQKLALMAHIIKIRRIGLYNLVAT